MKLKNILSFALILAIGLTSCNTQTKKKSEAVNVRIKGSDTVLPLTQKEAETYMNNNATARITVTGGGSGIGLAALLDGTTDIAMASRGIKFKEKMTLEEKGKKVIEICIAKDALTIVVNNANKVTNLTREQLEGIFTGTITNWKEVGGEDLEIISYSRETTSGTYEFFKESVLLKQNYKSGILSMPATGAIIQSVSQTPGAIGYVGMAYVTSEVKQINVSYDGGKNYIEPTRENAKSGAYPIVRPLFYYYEVNSGSTVKPFIDFILSEEGQKIVSEIGYIPVK